MTAFDQVCAPTKPTEYSCDGIHKPLKGQGYFGKEIEFWEIMMIPY